MTRTPPEYFQQLYHRSPDPWGFDTRWYEQRKYALTVACLPEERYHSAFEPGCSIGALTEWLAPRCDRLLAVDHMAPAIATAQDRLRSFAHVQVERREIPEDWPAGPFDLLVLSEVCYYFDAEELGKLWEQARGSLSPSATVIAVHYRGETDYPLTAEQTHEILAADPAQRPLAHHEEEQFLIDVWRYQP